MQTQLQEDGHLSHFATINISRLSITNSLDFKLLTELVQDEGMLVISGILGSFFDTAGK